MNHAEPSAAVTSVLSADSIKTAKPGDVLKDTVVQGLHLRVFPQSKVFYLYYRTKSGIQRRPKLGQLGQLTIASARKVAQELMAEVAAGRDPSADRAVGRSEPTLNELWDEYWKRHGSKKKTAAEDERMWLTYLKPRFGTRKLSAIGFQDVDDNHAKMADTPVQANRVLALMSKMFSFSHRPLQWYSDNPCKGVKRYKERKRRRKGSREEVQNLIALLRHELDTDNRNSAAFIWLLLTTGARSGEIRVAKWTEIDGNRLLLDEHKTDDGGYARIVYLPQVALDVLALLPKTKGTLTGIQSPKKLWNRLRRDAGCPDLTMHDLRRTFASFALSTGQVTLEQVMQMLGHTSAQTTKVYAWLMEDAATTAAEATATALHAPIRLLSPGR